MWRGQGAVQVGCPGGDDHVGVAQGLVHIKVGPVEAHDISIPAVVGHFPPAAGVNDLHGDYAAEPIAAGGDKGFEAVRQAGIV